MTLQHCLVFAVVLFSLGAAGVVARRSFPVVLVSLWIMFLGAGVAALSFARWNLLSEGIVAAVIIGVVGICAVGAGAIFFVARKGAEEKDIEDVAEKPTPDLDGLE